MPIIVDRDRGNADLFTSVTGADSTVVPGLTELKQVLATGVEEYAIVLGPTVDLEAAAALSDTLRVTRPATSVILVRRRLDTSVLAEALRSGMREVVEERDLTGLGAAVRRAGQTWQALTSSRDLDDEERRGRVYTVFSPKGGVGKTTLAVNLALALAAGGDRRVCLVDLDLAFGDVAITLQLFPARTLADVIQLQNDLDFPTLETLLTPHDGGISTLVAPVQPDAKDAISPRLVGSVLGLLRANFDVVVIDTSPTFDEHVLQALDDTDEVLLVTTLDVPTLKNVKIALETLDLLNFPQGRRRLVLNRADEKVGLSVEKVESTLNVRISASIPTSADVPNATNSGQPIVAKSPKHPVSLAISALAGELSARPGAVPAAVTEPASPRRRGLLRRSGRS